MTPITGEMEMERSLREAKYLTGITDFVRESNKIEGINRDPSKPEINAHKDFLAIANPTTRDIEALVAVCAPGHQLRAHAGLDVRVGSHIAPPGGIIILVKLDDILADLDETHPYHIHQRYEYLHPFTDGNGRSGRALWLWCMKRHGGLSRALGLGFLHAWYYQSLELSPAPEGGK